MNFVRNMQDLIIYIEYHYWNKPTSSSSHTTKYKNGRWFEFVTVNYLSTNVVFVFDLKRVLDGTSLNFLLDHLP